MPWDPARAHAAKTLLGRPLRVLLAAWVLARRGQAFFQSEAQDAMRAYKEAPSGVKAQLDQLAGLGMLSRVEDERRVWFSQRPSPYWRIFEAAAVAFELLEPAEARGKAPEAALEAVAEQQIEGQAPA